MKSICSCRTTVATLAALTCLLAAPATAQDQAETAASLRTRATAAYQSADWDACARLYAAAAEAGSSRRPTTLFNAACCAARGGQPARALELLERSLAAGWRSAEDLRGDSDLVTLHDQPAWQGILAAAEKAEEAFTERVHTELYKLYREDQSDRHQRPIDWSVVSQNDAARRTRVTEILAAGEAEQAEDFYHAAMVFQHSQDTADFARARDLAQRAFELDPGHDAAKWLSAAAHDRWLHSQDKPQVYGTQFKKHAPDSPWTLEPFDPDAVSDEERLELGVPPIAEAHRRVERMNAPSQ